MRVFVLLGESERALEYTLKTTAVFRSKTLLRQSRSTNGFFALKSRKKQQCLDSPDNVSRPLTTSHTNLFAFFIPQ